MRITNKLIAFLFLFAVTCSGLLHATDLSKEETVNYLKDKFDNVGTGKTDYPTYYSGVKIIDFNNDSCDITVDIGTYVKSGDSRFGPMYGRYNSPRKVRHQLRLQDLDSSLTWFTKQNDGSVELAFYCYEHAPCMDIYYQVALGSNDYERKKYDYGHLSFGISNSKDAIKVKKAMHYLIDECSNNSSEPF